MMLPEMVDLHLSKKREGIIENAIESNKNDFGSCSTRLISQETGICNSSVHTIMRHHLLLYPYKMKLLQHITDDDKIRRQEFGIWLLWTDEAYFHLHGEINRQNYRIWTTLKVTETLSCSLHLANLCVWFAFTSSYCLTPYFFDGTVTSVKYLEMLRSHVILQISAKRKMKSLIFMKDGAPLDYAKNVRDYLTKMLDENRVISRGFPQGWLARSPGLNPLEYWFCGTLKARVFHVDSPKTLKELKNRIFYGSS